MLRRLALAVSALTGLPLGLAWLVSNQMMHPRARVEDHTLEDFALPARDISFPSRDGTRLSGWFIPAGAGDAPAPALVLSHGWARSRAELLPHADILHRAGFAALMFDFRHRGHSGGDAITMGVREQDDLLGALDALAAQPEVDGERLGAFGMSMGGAVTILVAARDRRVRFVVTECPYGSTEVIMTRSLRHYSHLPSFPLGDLAKLVLRLRLGVSLDGAQPDRSVGAISPRPLYIIACERDRVIGAAETERLFRAAREPKRFWLIPDAEHARGWQAAPGEYERRLLEFLAEAVPAAGRTPRDGEAAL